MKLHQIALAVAALAVGTAHADLPNGSAAETVVNNANANGRVVYISGASAVKKGFSGIINSLFSGTTYWFAEGAKSDYLAVAGKLAAAAGTWNAGDDVIVIYRTGGGSVYGVNPVARAEAITSLNVSDASCGSAGTGASTDPYICAQDTRVPDAGVSDVAPAMFKAPVNTEGEIPADSLNEAELADLTATPIYGLSFGVPVTSTVPAGVKFTRSVVSAIMTGNVGTWDQVDSSLSGDILICRRTPGSGTQAVMNMWAGNFPCSDLANAPADRDSTGMTWDPVARTFTHTASYGGLVVVENFASGDVATCLDKAVTGGTYTTKDRDGKNVTVDFGAGGHKAIGVLSMDSLGKSKTSGNWQFRSLDGAGKIVQDTAGAAPTTTGDGKFPTLAAYENGDWDLQGWVSFNVPSRTTGNKLALATAFLNKAQDPAILADIGDLKYVAAGIPGNGYTGAQVLDAAYLNGNQCAPYSRNYND